MVMSLWPCFFGPPCMQNKSVFSYYVRRQRGTARINPPYAWLQCAVQQSIDLLPAEPQQETLLLWPMLGHQTDRRTPDRCTDLGW